MVDFNDAFKSMGTFTNQALDAIGRNQSIQNLGNQFTPAVDFARRIGSQGITRNAIFNINQGTRPNRSTSSNDKQVEGVDSSYLVTLTAQNLNETVFGFKNLKISAYLPQNYSMQFGSSWGTPLDKTFGEAIQSIAGNNVSGTAGKIVNRTVGGLNLGTQLFGTANRHKLQTAHIWQSGQPLSLSIPFHFAANSNTYDDVLRHFRSLSMLASPHEVDGVLYPPGPTLGGAAIRTVADALTTGKLTGSSAFASNLEGLSGNLLTIKIGEFAVIEPIIIESVDSAIDTLHDTNGKPMFMAINVNIKSYYTMSANDISRMINHPLLRVPAETLITNNTSQAQSEQPLLYDQEKARYGSRGSAGIGYDTNSSGDYNG